MQNGEIGSHSEHQLENQHQTSPNHAYLIYNPNYIQSVGSLALIQIGDRNIFGPTVSVWTLRGGGRWLMNCAKKGWVCRTNPCESGYVVALFQETLHYWQALWCASMFINFDWKAILRRVATTSEVIDVQNLATLATRKA